MNQHVIQSLETLLADSYALYLKTQNYHWNVTGPQFPYLHAMFETQYTDLAAAVDLIAERIRALGAKAPGSFKDFSEMTSIKDATKNADAAQMLKELTADHQILVDSLKRAFDVAQKVEDEVTVGLLIERMNVHEKTHWMLQASVG